MPIDVPNTQQQTIQSQLPIDLGQFATTLSNLYANDPTTGGIVQLFLQQTKNYLNGYNWAMQQAQQQTGAMPTGQAQEFIAQQGQRYYGNALQQLDSIATAALQNKTYLDQLKMQYAQWQQQFAENQRQFNVGSALQQQGLDLERGKANMAAFAQGMQGLPTLSQLAGQELGKKSYQETPGEVREQIMGSGGTSEVYDPQSPSGRFLNNAIDNLSQLPAGSSIALDNNGRQMIDPLTGTVTYDIPGQGQAMYKATSDATTPRGTPVFIPIQYQAAGVGASYKYQPPVLGGDLTTQQNPYQQPSNFYNQQQNQGQPYNMYSSLGSYVSQSPISQSISNITGTGLRDKPAPSPNVIPSVSTGNASSITGFYTGGGGISPQSNYTGSGAYTGGSWASPATTGQGFYSSYSPGSQGYYGI